MSTTEGESPAVRSSRSPDAEVVITTVVSAEDNGPSAAPGEEGGAGDRNVGGDVVWAGDDAAASPKAARRGDELAAVEQRLAALEKVPASVEALGKAIRHELERCAGVLFGHDRALGALATRLDAVEAPAPDEDGAGRGVGEGALASVAAHLEALGRRLAAIEARAEPLEPLPTVVAALRRAVRASDERIAAETDTREKAIAALASELATEAQARDEDLRRLVAQDLDRVSAVSNAQGKGLADLAERVAGVERRMAPLDNVPEELAGVGRTLRRELDAVVADNQARDQMLRRALQNEIDQMRTASDAREALATELTTRVESLETRATEAALTQAQALGTASGRLETLEGRIAAVDRLSDDLALLRDALSRELEHLRANAQAHDQLASELTRRLAALDGRMARLDAVPGEVQSMRTVILQEAERTVSSLRVAEERIGQLSWVPGEFQEARKRIIALTSGVQAGQERVRQLEAALAATNERLEALRARLPSTVTQNRPT